MTKLAIFLFGITLGMWGDAALVELENASMWRLFSPPSIEFNHDVIEDALEPVAEDGDEEEEPGANWLNEVTPAFRPA